MFLPSAYVLYQLVKQKCFLFLGTATVGDKESGPKIFK